MVGEFDRVFVVDEFDVVVVGEFDRAVVIEEFDKVTVVRNL